MSEWQPIETAPKDGQYLLLWGNGVFQGFWNGRSWDDGDFYDEMSGITHWMPLPAGPEIT